MVVEALHDLKYQIHKNPFKCSEKELKRNIEIALNSVLIKTYNLKKVIIKKLNL